MPLPRSSHDLRLFRDTVNHRCARRGHGARRRYGIATSSSCPARSEPDTRLRATAANKSAHRGGPPACGRRVSRACGSVRRAAFFAGYGGTVDPGGYAEAHDAVWHGASYASTLACHCRGLVVIVPLPGMDRTETGSEWTLPSARSSAPSGSRCASKTTSSSPPTACSAQDPYDSPRRRTGAARGRRSPSA